MTVKMKRRDFVKTSLAATSGIASAVTSTSAKTVSPQTSPNSQIRVGMIGCGGQGNSDANHFSRIPNVRIVALADVYEGSIKNTLNSNTLKLDAAKTTVYSDFRRLLDNKDLDAVIIATPDHWHALTMVMACQAGKDVYVEKPLSLTIEEGRRMVNAARKHNRVVQVGTQQRSAKHFQVATQMVRDGKIGKVARVHTWNYDLEYPNGIGNPANASPPAGLDWNFYLGPAPAVPFNENRFLWNFRWFWDYSGGKLTDWGVHLIDIVHWGMNVDAPLSASATGRKYVVEDNRETPDTLMVTYEYPGFILTYENRAFTGRTIENRGYGIAFYGTDATLIVDRSGFEIIPEFTGRRRDDIFTPRVPPARMGLPRVDTSHFDHVKNFVECMSSRKLPISDVEIGHRSTSAPLLGNIALHTGRTIKWDGQNEKIIGDVEASKRLGKEYRQPWKLVDV